jgi:hypothetical protein
MPVNASVDPGDVDGDEVPPVPVPVPVPPVVEGLVAGLLELPPVVPWLLDRVAPAAGLAVRISGTTQAAAPALAATDIRPSAWRLENVRPGRASPGATGDVPTSRFVACLFMSSARPFGDLEGESTDRSPT